MGNKLMGVLKERNVMTKFDMVTIAIAMIVGGWMSYIAGGVFGVMMFVGIVGAVNTVWYLTWPLDK